MSEHKELVQDLQDCRFSFGAGVALKPRDKVNPFDKLMLDSLEKAIAVLQGSTEDTVTISRELMGKVVSDMGYWLSDLGRIGPLTTEEELKELRDALEKKQ